MSVSIDELSDEAYYELFYTELKEAISPMGWNLLVHTKTPWLSVVQTLAYSYDLDCRRWQEPKIKPEFSAPSRRKLTDVIDSILTKKRS